MTDVIRQVAAEMLEAPEVATDLMGRALSAIGDELQRLSDRIDALEDQLRGGAQ